ncbi:MAG: GNAT family N-acetyltransferase [Planctomycetota bacterium]|jgi:GNAT superfamily N-acetyltransferase
MVEVREARESDVDGIRAVFQETYGATYRFEQFYDLSFLRRLIVSEDNLMFVAEEQPEGHILGTASVMLEVGAFSDLLGLFGRLAVVPDAQGRGIGTMLMEARLAAVRDRLHVALVDARVSHPYSLRIAQKSGFAVVGFSPSRHVFDLRESTCTLAQWFGEALSLRFNNPRIIPEVYPLAALSLSNAGLLVDPIVDDDSPPYPHETDFDCEEMTTTGYSTLLRIERGRLRNREVFGPMRLHYGFFKLRRRHAEYLVARRERHIAGAIGFLRDEHDRAIRVFELIAPDDRAIHFLLKELVTRCQEQWSIFHLEIDVRANSPRLQRTLLELGFTPGAYIPSMVFHEVERYDVVRMIRLFGEPVLGEVHLSADARAVCALVMAPLEHRAMLPRLARCAASATLFHGIAEEQFEQLARCCSAVRFAEGERLVTAGERGDALYLLAEGEAEVLVSDGRLQVGVLGAGETVGEMGLLRDDAHDATVVARSKISAIRLPYSGLMALVRRRPDIGVVIFRNMATGLGDKLRRADHGLGMAISE